MNETRRLFVRVRYAGQGKQPRWADYSDLVRPEDVAALELDLKAKGALEVKTYTREQLKDDARWERAAYRTRKLERREQLELLPKPKTHHP